MEIVLGIILLIMAVFLVASVLMQSSKNHRMSGSVAGGAETFFGKQKGKTLDSVLSKVTTVIAIIFVILVVVIYVIQPNNDAQSETELDPETQALIDEATESVIGNEDEAEGEDEAETETETETEEKSSEEDAENNDEGAEAENTGKDNEVEVKLVEGDAESDNEVDVSAFFGE